jgi:phosphotransferase family enzyme
MDGEAQGKLPGCGLGGAVRIGDTVRRRAGRWTPTIHALLDHLDSAGLDAVPRALGFDEHGREVLSLIEGQTVYSTRDPDGEGWPEWAYSDGLLVQAAQWLARYHRAVRTFRPSQAEWRSGPRPLGAEEIVCHYDFRAANVVVSGVDGTGGTPQLVGVVDWDTAGPGRPLFDVALAAWNWVPLWDSTGQSTADLVRRLKLFAAAYGAFSPFEVLGAVPDRLDAVTDMTEAMAAAGDEAMRNLVASGLTRQGRDFVPVLRNRLPDLFRELARTHPDHPS